ncbi:peptidase S45 penicillin amidase [Chloroherpeton thalassium ATCC 35110]|uniref:Peptidase S45 penicillin amidase n=1 Tax=Chloroherpeton thalassium (strain ATCC 35110 / GB-78) TaxID=517418 RepID=B3QRW7_CHLT3|nr:penicillin acylase family protein [Chloroherpeton thalassium]ACF13920.1 peptidase S45 penicillin amidase [Chloroherpeton thalassium ATCC 35110]
MQLNGKKLAIGVATSVLIILLGVAGVLYHVLHKSIPDYSASYELGGLHAKTQIFYDTYAAAHILAENQHDLFFAQGYAQARDRLWQMDLQRRAAEGKLAEIFGDFALDYDKHMRTIGIKRMADTLWQSNALSEESRFVLQAFSEGVNAYLKQVQDGDVNLALEFDALGYTPEPWQPEDCLAIIRMMGWELNIAWHIDVALAELTEKLGYQKALQVYPESPKDARLVIPTEYLPKELLANSTNPDDKSPRFGKEASDLLASLTTFKNADRAYRAWAGTLGSHIGSNAWAVTRSKSATGGAILANDPHLGFTTPSRWHEVQLLCPAAGIDGAGCSLPGVPAIVLGRNANLAWGITNMMLDDCDFFISSDSLEGGYEEIVEMIQVKNSDPVPFIVRLSKFGTVLAKPMVESLLKTNLANLAEKDIVMKWTGYEKSDELGAFLGILKAADWNEFRAALCTFALPGQNFVYADRNGNIGYQSAGLLPIRDDRQGYSLRDAANTAQHWKGYAKFDELPRVYNPPSDMLVTANNKIVDDRYKYYISSLWEPDSRADRISELLLAKEKLSAEDFQHIQVDVVSPQARNLMPYLMNALQSDTAQAHRRAIEYLKNWPFDFSKSSIGATIFSQFFVRLMHNTFADEMGEPLFMSYVSLVNAPTRVLQQLLADSSFVEVQQDSVMTTVVKYNAWFDDIATPEMETRDDIIRKSFAEAIQILRSHLGHNEAAWRWDAIHTLSVQHVFGQAGQQEKDQFVAKAFNFATAQTAGTSTTINNGEFYFSKLNYDKNALLNAAHAVGASSRRVIDLNNQAEFLSVLPGGNSGEMMSSHYHDQFPLWLEGKLRTFVTEPKVFVQQKFDLTELNPKQ